MDLCDSGGSDKLLHRMVIKAELCCMYIAVKKYENNLKIRPT